MMSKHFTGERKLDGTDLYALRLIAQVKGWGGEVGKFQNNVQINFTQADGRG